MSLVIKFEPGLRPVIKHQEHDQSSHGSWASSSERSAKEIEVQQRITDVKVGSFERDKYDDDDKNLYQKIEAKYKTKDGKTYLLSQENIKTPDGNNIIEVFSYEPKTLASGKPGRKQIGSLGTEGRDSSIIDGVYVEEEHQRQGLATAMLNMARTYAPGNMKISHSFSLTDDAKGWSGVVKHQEHDQSSHGNWATGQKGGSGLSHREMYELKKQPDPIVRKVYDAEEKNHNQIQDKNAEQPSAPNRADFTEYSDYDAAYKKYSKDFLNWSRKVTTSVISPIGKKHLDGTPTGVNGYVRDVLRQDWFVEAFGKGGVAGNNLEVKVSSTGEAGAYQFGFKNNLPISILRVNRGYSKAEPTIIHEIAHYATTISATSPHAAHGVEFARNHIFIAGKVMGDSFAQGLEKSYREAGVPLGD
jgi:hypothetical protein